MGDNIDFDHLSELFKTDPEKFERVRREKIEQMIQSASESSQRRLRGLQFQIDAKREIYKHKPFVSCMEISKMMHSSFEKMRYELNKCAGNKRHLDYQPQNNLNLDAKSPHKVTILPIKR
jgi:hypothetical protein